MKHTYALFKPPQAHEACIPGMSALIVYSSHSDVHVIGMYIATSSSVCAAGTLLCECQFQFQRRPGVKMLGGKKQLLFAFDDAGPSMWQFKKSHSPSKEVIVSAIVDVFSVLCLSSALR